MKFDTFVVEVTATADDAQTLLEIYLRKYAHQCGEGRIEPLFLDQLLAYLSYGQVIIPRELGAIVKPLLVGIPILPRIVFLGRLKCIPETVFQEFSLVDPSEGEKVLNLAKVLTPVCRGCPG